MNKQRLKSNSRRVNLLAGTLVGAILGLFGCANEAAYRTPERYDRGLILILPGIEGKGFFNDTVIKGLSRHGAPQAFEIHDWTTGNPLLFLYHLSSYEKNRVRAELTAKRLQDYRDDYPGRPVWLIGLSGGGGILPFVLEALPDDYYVEAAFLMAPTISPEYNLAKALKRCRNYMVNYYSPRDMILSGLGTTIFGTIDRAHTSAAARYGFKPPKNLSPEDALLYKTRLIQIVCGKHGNTPGHIGIHITSSSPKFVEKVIGPLITDSACEKLRGENQNSRTCGENPR